MSKRSPKAEAEKLAVVSLLLKQENSLTKIRKQYRVDDQTSQAGKKKYEKFGMNGLRESRKREKNSSCLVEHPGPPA
ncbi:hypothetical protein, partial [Streptococcus thoraltensis]